MFIFLEEMSGMPTVDSSTASSMCDFVRRKFLAARRVCVASQILNETTHFGCGRQELRYNTAYALQNRLLSALQDGHDRMLHPSLTSFWTPPSSSHNLMPNTAAVLGCTKEDRDFFGGWSDQGSDRHTRIARFRISNQQRAVTSTWR